MKKIVLNLLLLATINGAAFSQVFKVEFPVTTSNKSFTGNVLLYLSKNNHNPKDEPVDLEEFPSFRTFVKNISPGQSITIDDRSISFPVKLSDIERGDYYVQAVFDHNLGGRAITSGAGNVYSDSKKIRISNNKDEVFYISAGRLIPESIFKETTYAKELKVKSALLSRFYGKNTTINAAVLLPQEYNTTSNKKFPVLFYMLPFGGDYHTFSAFQTAGKPLDTSSCITVILDGNCPNGNSEYANSENNGPWGDALVKEFIPQLEKEYRCIGARLITGHSSGGWSALWLQVHYPTTFHGCWSSSPAPVDYRSFQKIDLYQSQNMFYGKDSTLNQAGTIAGRFPWFSMKNAQQEEHVIYRGEQMQSYNAVFSPKGKDGRPESICDYLTGAVDSNVFAHWKKYDISLYLRNNWDHVKPDLEGKIRITVGQQDNFLLNYSLTLLETEMKKLNADMEIRYYPGDHFTVKTPQFTKDAFVFLEKKYQDWKVSNKIK